MICPICKKGASENYQILINGESIFFCSEGCLNTYAESLRLRGIPFTSKTLGTFPITIELSETEEDTN